MVRWLLVLLHISSFGSIALCEVSKPSEPIDSLIPVMEQQLQVDIVRQELKARQLTRLQSMTQTEGFSNRLLNKVFFQKVTHRLMLQEAELNNIELTLKETQMGIELIQANLNSLQRRNLDIRRNAPTVDATEASIRQQNKLLEIQQKRFRTLQNTRDTLYKTVNLTRDWYKQLHTRKQSIIQNQHQIELHGLVDRLAYSQQQWREQLEYLNHQADSQNDIKSLTKGNELTFLVEMMITEEENNALHTQLDLEKIRNELHRLYEDLTHNPPLMILNSLQKPLDTIANHLHTLKAILNKKQSGLEGHMQLITQNQGFASTVEEKRLKAALVSIKQRICDYAKQSEQVDELVKQVQVSQNLFSQQLHTYLSNRQSLPGLDRWAWFNILRQLQEIPALFSHRLLGLYHLVLSAVQQASWFACSLSGMIGLAWVQCFIFLKRFTKKYRSNIMGDEQSSEIKPHLFTLWVNLLHSYAGILVICLAIASGLFSVNIPLSAFLGLFSLIGSYLFFSILLKVCRFWLIETANDSEREGNKRLYHWIYGILVIGQLITHFSLLVHQLILDYEVRNLVARLFMLFLFIIALILFRIWALVPKLLEGYWSKRPRYLKQVVRWLSFLLPAALLVNAILGVVGYVQLAWAIVGYQSVLLLALGIYPFIKGLLNEGFNWLSEQSIRHLRNGWLWSEALLKPIYQLLKLFTLVFIIVILFCFAGWREELVAWSTYPAMWFNKPLLVVFDTPIDTWNLIQAGILGLFVAWLARWSREFAYRWIFSNLKDLGLRNSLSVFTQYMAIFLSVLATLQVIGITISVLKYILSGFAIGLSFGLRDLFNNFVTGILLLVERPLKVGDWVTVGDYEGQVTHIGARSITVNTEDHQELMVPNADLFYKHFINWTRHDSIVRITLPLFVNRSDDPIRVRELILEVLATTAKILQNPSPEVYFKATDQMLLSFKIEYYVDLTQITSRSEVNSQFLFALWERFTQENIKPPELIQAVQVKGELAMEPLLKSNINETNA